MPEIPNCFYRVSIKGLILDEARTRFLVIQERSGEWELPGGGLDWREDPHEALKREIKEEMGLEAVWIEERPSYFLTRIRNAKGAEVVNVLYEMKLTGLDFIPSKECVDIRFVTPEEAKCLITTENVQALAAVFDPKNHFSR